MADLDAMTLLSSLEDSFLGSQVAKEVLPDSLDSLDGSDGSDDLDCLDCLDRQVVKVVLPESRESRESRDSLDVDDAVMALLGSSNGHYMGSQVEEALLEQGMER